MTARTLRWTGAVSNDESNALNWYDETNGHTATTPPAAGDTTIVAFGTVDVPTDTKLSDNTIHIGGTAGAATVVFTGTAGTTLTAPTVDNGSTIDSAVPGQTTAEQSVLDAIGTFVNQGLILADGPTGSTFTIAVDPNGSAPGYFYNPGTIEADAGNTIDIVVGSTSEIFNSGLILANGGSVLITTTGSDQIVGGYAPIVGLVAIQDGGTVEFNAALPYDPTSSTTTSGVRFYFAFTDGTSGDLLKIDQITQFSGNVLGFENGDTIDVGALPTITSYTYDQNGILTLSAASGIVASLVVAGNFNTGTFHSSDSFLGGSFDITTSGGDTLIATPAVNDVWIANSGTWTTGGNWSGSSPPGGGGVGVIGNGTAQTYTVQTGTGSVSVGLLILNNADATLEIGGTLDVTPGTFLSTLQQIGGTIQVDTGATLVIDSLRQFQADTALDLETGSTLLAEGRPSTSFTNDGSISLDAGGNRFGLSLQGTTTIDDAILNASTTQPGGYDGGNILIGQDGAGAPASVLVEAGGTVSDTYSVLYSSPTSSGTLTITGANTVWDDVGDPSDTQNTRGDILIGRNDQYNNTPTPFPTAGAFLLVDAGAVLNDASFANIGDTVDSSGVAAIDGATWNIGNLSGSGSALGFLQVGRDGFGALTIESGGTVAVGGGGTILNNGSSETVNYAVEIGHYAGAIGALTLEGAGSKLTTLNELIDGDAGSGTFTVETGAKASIGGAIALGGGKGSSDGGTGTLTIETGGQIEQNANAVFAIWSGSTVTVTANSSVVDPSGIDVGNSGTFVDGAIHVDSGSVLRGDGKVAASVDNAGSVHATNNSTYDLSTGGLLDITGNVTGTGNVYMAPGATLEIDGTIAATQTINFDNDLGLAQTFILGTPGSQLTNQIKNLQNFDRIGLGGLNIQSASVTSPGTVTVDLVGGGTYLLTDVNFAVGASQNFITGSNYIQVTCFAAGTRIATPDGEVAVEDLEIGRHVVTVIDGRPQPVQWIGRRHIDCRRHPWPASVWPVRVRAGAFGPGPPARDLFLSPDHAVLVDGVLIPVKYLINRTSIAQVPRDTVTYYHIELARHDAVLAEGLPAESYLDTDDRGKFDNGAGPVRLHPDLSSLVWEAKGCAPLVVTGPILAAARARLAASVPAVQRAA
jgi:T5SS/PEP-CTERM-associated repeat protein